MTHEEHQHHEEPRHEDFQVDTSGVFKAGVVLFLFVLLSVGGLMGAYYFWLTPTPHDLGTENEPPDGGFLPARQTVVLDADQGEQLTKYRKDQQTLLDGYDWLDEEHKTARIPIDRAMEILSERGLPARPKPEEPK